jgi:hypothetical protein
MHYSIWASTLGYTIKQAQLNWACLMFFALLLDINI